MNEELHIIRIDNPDHIPWSIIGGGINAYNAQQAGDDAGQNLCFVLRDADDTIVGSVIGATYWDWLYINLIWIKEAFRGLGYGQQLMAAAEEEARQRGAKHAYLDTFSFQAPDFYKKLGYEIFGELADFPVGHQRYFLKKQLY